MPERTSTLDEFDGDTRISSPGTARPRQKAPRSGGANAPRRRPVPDSTGPRQQTAPRNKNTRRVAARQTPKYGLIDFLRDRRTHLGFGIFLCFVAMAMAGSGISYVFNFSQDQSAVHDATLQQLTMPDHEVETLFGALGAFIADKLLINTFGLASFVLVVYVFILGLASMHVKKISFFTLSFRCLFTTAALSVILGLAGYNSGSEMPLGGHHGHYINEIVLKYSDVLGAFFLSALLCGLLFALYLYPIKSFFVFVKNILPKPKARVECTVGETEVNDRLESLGAPDNEHEADDTFPEAESSDNDDYRRFMPQADLDDFDEESVQRDDEVSEPESEMQDDAPEGFENGDDMPPVEYNDPLTEIPTEVHADAHDTSDGPELVIVNNSLSDSSEDQHETSMAPIRHGDHIGIDVPFDVRAEHSQYIFPPIDLLVDRPKTFVVNEDEQAANKELIVNSLRSYNVEIERIQATIGPTVTLYEIVPVQGTRISTIKSLEDDIAMSLSAPGIRIIAPIPGKGTIGIEVPNRKPQVVSMRSILESEKFRNTKMKLPMALGATIANDIFMYDLAKTPHLLVAGATGQGKSVGLNCIITSLLYSKHPDELKFVLIDPKMVEFSLYASIDRQYLAKISGEESAVITDMQKVMDTLNSLCVEMDHRYELLRMAGVRSLEEYNERFCKRNLNPELGHRFLPYIVMIVDEYADLVMTAGKEISNPICRIAQKARAVGMHLIIATQRPSTDIITGKIKANFPARIAFKVTQGVDSKTIIDRPGAQRLIGRGDMLVMCGDTIERVQCAWVDTPEVESICRHISEQPGFTSCYALPDPPSEDGGDISTADIAITDEFRRCAMFISTLDSVSITLLQRKFEIGFGKAARFMDQMETLGIVSKANGAKPRQVLLDPDDVERILG